MGEGSRDSGCFMFFFLPKTTVLGSGGVLVDALLYVLLDCIVCIFLLRYSYLIDGILLQNHDSCFFPEGILLESLFTYMYLPYMRCSTVEIHCGMI